MNNIVRNLFVATAIFVIASPASADMQSCMSSETRSGKTGSDGIRIEFTDFIPAVSPDVAFDRIYRSASNKFEVTASDRQTRTISASAQMAKGGGFLGQLLQTSDMTYRMTFNFDPAPGGTKILLILKFRQGISVSRGGAEEYCETIQAAFKK